MEDSEVTQPIESTEAVEEAVLQSDPKDDLIAKLQDQLAEQKDHYMRMVAEAENLRKRAYEESIKSRKFAVEAFAENLLSVADSLNMALTGDADKIDRVGVEMTLEQLTSAFTKAKIKTISPSEATEFDPKYHQAVKTEDGEVDNQIVRVLQLGYMLEDRILRPAMVVVSKQKQEEITNGQDQSRRSDEDQDGQDQTGTTEYIAVEGNAG